MAYAFISYSHADEYIAKRLLTHMSQLKRDGLLTAWYDEEILTGDKLGDEISEELEKADVFLAIISPDYLNSGYCYDVEFKRALEKFQAGTMRIVPIIAQPCDWKPSPFGKFKAIPKDGKPISEFTNENNALLNVIDELRKMVSVAHSQHPRKQIMPNSSKPAYKIKRDFDAVDLLNFRDETFSFIYEYFKEALDEINDVDQIKARFVNDQPKQQFTCVITNRSKIDATGYISIGIHNRHDHFGAGNGISFTLAEHMNVNVYGNNFTIEQSDYDLYWVRHNPMYQQSEVKKLSAKEIADLLWDEFIDQVGINR